MTYERAEPGQVPSAFVPPKASHPVPRTPPSWGPGSAALLSLQRSAGNRAATLAVQAGGGRHLASASPGTDVDSEHVRERVVQPASTVQRVPTVQRAPSKAVKAQLEARLPLLQSNARLVESHSALGESYVNLSVATTDLISTKLQLFSLFYDMAYSRYADVIGKGRAEAQNQTLWRGIFLGIGTGVLAGLAAAYIAPSTAAAWFTLTLADAATAAGSSFLQASASSVVAYALSDLMTARGSDLQPGGLSPDMLRSHVWQHVAGMYRGAFTTTKVLSSLHKNSLLLEKTIAETRVHIAGGDSKFTPEDIVKAGDIMNNRVTAMKTVFDGLRSSADQLRVFADKALSYNPAKPTVDQMEDDIWIMWIGSLSDDDSDILDLDAIEDHLKARGIIGPNSRLGVDFEGYTSEDDELAAISAGRRQAGAVRERYDKATASWNVSAK